MPAAIEPRFCRTWIWQAGNVMMWDNRGTMHRTQMCGDKP